MNSTPNNIDELLKTEFRDFNPENPDVWYGIEQGLASANTGASQGQFQAGIKGGLASTKTIVWVAGLTIFATAVFTYMAVFNKQIGKEELPKPKVAEMPSERKENNMPAMEQSVVIDQGPLPVAVENEPLRAATGKKKTKSGRQISNSVDENKLSENKDAPRQDIATQQRKEINNNNADLRDKQTYTDEVSDSRTHIANKHENNAAKTPLEANQREKSSWEYEEEARLSIPGSFSPNGDTFNDEFVVEIENDESFYFMILDLSGKVVFETNSKEKRWNGLNRINGEECTAGWYVYTLRYRLKGLEREHVKSGKFKLVR